MRVLILSMPGDAHALATKWALERRGSSASILCWSDFPQAISASVEIGASGKAVGKIDGICLDSVDVLWNHRTMTAVPPSEIDKADHQPIRDGSEHFYRGLVAKLEQTAFAINPSRAKAHVDNKLTQLSLAERCGFRIPSTLVSNDLPQIKAFSEKHASCILKPLRFMRWRGESEVITLYTRKIPDLDTVNPMSVTACPMIYQEKIDKAYELRVVVFGSEVVGFRLGSQTDSRAATDWRAIDFRALPTMQEPLDEPLRDLILKFVRMCGLASGSLDLAVTPDGELVFFEINETGQFLWLEEICPEAPLLDMFVEFIRSRTVDFRYSPTAPPITFQDWKDAEGRNRASDVERHVPVNLDKRYPDEVA